jgi:tetratricopeptide (TPR) repeat protein
LPNVPSTFVRSPRRPASVALAIAALLAVAPASPGGTLGAQQPAAPARTFLSLDGKEPRRPKLEAGADTNDASAYLEWGNLRETPRKKAFDAYFWAYRLDPTRHIYLLNMFTAVYWAQSPGWRSEYWQGADFATKSKEARLLDSLSNMVSYREPFAHFTQGGRCVVDRDWLDYVSESTYLTAEHYFEQGCWTQAIDWYRKVLAKYPTHLGSRMNLVRSMHWTGQHGGALAQIDTTLAQLRAREGKYTSRFYVSKEQLETMRGEILTQMEDFNGAKKAYGRALEEELSYWPAHVRLALLASIQGEHDEALQEYDQAVQLADKEPAVHFDYGIALLRADKPAEAEREFRRAIELEPHFGLAYFNLALTLDRQGRREDAIAAYRTFLGRAAKRQAKMTTMATQRLAVLAPGQTFAR